MALTLLKKIRLGFTRVVSNVGQRAAVHRQRALLKLRYVTVRQRVINKALAEAWDRYFGKERLVPSVTLIKRVYFKPVELTLFFISLTNTTGIDWSSEKMAESDWDTVTVLRKKGPTAAQAKSKQVSMSTSSVLDVFRNKRAARNTLNTS